MLLTWIKISEVSTTPKRHDGDKVVDRHPLAKRRVEIDLSSLSRFTAESWIQFSSGVAFAIHHRLAFSVHRGAQYTAGSQVSSN